MKHQFEFKYDALLVRNALRRDLMWKGYVLAGVLLAVAALLYAWGGPGTPGVAGLIMAAPVVVILLHIKLRQTANRICELWDAQSPGGTIRYELDDDGFDVVMEKSSSRFEWAQLRRLWRYRDVWLIEIVRMQSVFFPPDHVSQDILDFITGRCQAADVRVGP